ncbi:hypothetical protein ACLB2K_065738 [Fragaria x ananassa]
MGSLPFIAKEGSLTLHVSNVEQDAHISSYNAFLWSLEEHLPDVVSMILHNGEVAQMAVYQMINILIAKLHIPRRGTTCSRQPVSHEPPLHAATQTKGMHSEETAKTYCCVSGLKRIHHQHTLVSKTTDPPPSLHYPTTR